MIAEHRDYEKFFATQKIWVEEICKFLESLNRCYLRYIQTLLGHARLETTQIYTRVAKHNLKNIKNPLD